MEISHVKLCISFLSPSSCSLWSFVVFVSLLSYVSAIRTSTCESTNSQSLIFPVIPAKSGIHNNLAWLYATATDEKFRDTGKALEHAQKAAELSKGQNPQIMDTLARAYYINGKIEEAIETAKKALELEPENKGFQERVKTYEEDL